MGRVVSGLSQGRQAHHRRAKTLLAEVAAMPGRIPLVISGDLHAIAEGRIQRTGAIDLGKNPVVVILSGPLGTGDQGWPSGFRGIGATASRHLAMGTDLKPMEE